jgi:hypothetical protein
MPRGIGFRAYPPAGARSAIARPRPGTASGATANVNVNKEVLTMVDAEIPPQSDDDTRRGLLASFSLEEVELLQVIVDTVIPEDAYPGGWR